MTRHVAVAEQGRKAPPDDACQVLEQLGWVEYLTPLRRQVPDVLDRLSSCVCWHAASVTRDVARRRATSR
jgi:hypothetical protein